MENTLISINEKDSYGRTALMCALNSGFSFEVIQWLINSGSSLNEIDNNYYTIPMYALINDYTVEEILILCTKDNINNETLQGDTLLTMTTKIRRKLIAPLINGLIKQFNSLRMSDGGNQLLQYAIDTDDEQLVTIILGHGCDVRRQILCGNFTTLPLICAASRQPTKSSERILRKVLNEVLYSSEPIV